MRNFVIRCLPRKALSHWVGRLMERRTPRWFVQWGICFLVWRYQIQISDALLPLDQFETIDAFFTRQIRPELRPIANSRWVHPADSYIQSFGAIKSKRAYQIKNKPYLLTDFFGGAKPDFEGGFYITYYLSPRDYHRVHSPVDGILKNCRWIDGDLWPVNERALENVDQLYSKNKRVIFEIETSHGLVAVVMVGALNVGRMTLSFLDPTDAADFNSVGFSGRSIKKGQELGVFHLGSTVVLFFDSAWIAAEAEDFSSIKNQRVHFGASAQANFKIFV